MILYFKVGSGPGVHMYVIRKRKPPAIDDRFLIRTPNAKYARQVSVRLVEIRDLGNELLYVVEKF